jgi:predicted RNase H-like nuclease (RuvC/YqgF family)
VEYRGPMSLLCQAVGQPKKKTLMSSQEGSPNDAETEETRQIHLLTQKLLEARELLRHLTTENAQLQTQQGEVEKLKKEVARLRTHLMEANDSQTTEQLSLSERITELESELTTSKQTSEFLQSELDRLKGRTGDKEMELQAALEQVKIWKQEWQNQSTALENLQIVLEQFSACKLFNMIC